MQYSILNDSAVNKEEREFVEKCQTGNHVHKEQMAAQIYSAAINRQSADKMINAAVKISASSSLYSWMMLGLSVAMLIAASAQAYAAFKSVDNEHYANSLNEVLTEHSRQELEIAKKKMSFDIINTLYKDFYQFADSNSIVIKKLKDGINIDNPENLGLYLNGFEDLYEQCKRGVISRQDILMNFQYLIGPTCNNKQVAKVIGNHGNGLKLLCNTFFSNTLLGNSAKKERDSCK